APPAGILAATLLAAFLLARRKAAPPAAEGPPKRRAGRRRPVRPVSVLVTDADGAVEAQQGDVADYSADGAALILLTPLPVRPAPQRAAGGRPAGGPPGPGGGAVLPAASGRRICGRLPLSGTASRLGARPPRRTLPLLDVGAAARIEDARRKWPGRWASPPR